MDITELFKLCKPYIDQIAITVRGKLETDEEKQRLCVMIGRYLRNKIREDQHTVEYKEEPTETDYSSRRSPIVPKSVSGVMCGPGGKVNRHR